MGPEHAHVDVSLWFCLPGNRKMTLPPDLTELRSTHWWTPREVLDEPATRFDPDYGRFVAKVCQ